MGFLVCSSWVARGQKVSSSSSCLRGNNRRRDRFNALKVFFFGNYFLFEQFKIIFLNIFSQFWWNWGDFWGLGSNFDDFCWFSVIFLMNYLLFSVFRCFFRDFFDDFVMIFGDLLLILCHSQWFFHDSCWLIIELTVFFCLLLVSYGTNGLTVVVTGAR